MTQTAVGYPRGGADDEDLAAHRQAGASLGLPWPRLSGPELIPSQYAHLTTLDAAYQHSISEPADAFSARRPRAYRVPARQESW